MTRKNVLWAGVLVLLLLAGIGCTPAMQSGANPGSASGGSTATAQASTEARATGTGVADFADSTRPTVTVDIKNFQFGPEAITVPPGTRIVFVNHDETPHNIVQGTPAQVSGKDHDPLFAVARSQLRRAVGTHTGRTRRL